MTIYAIGDIHGEIDLLSEVVTTLRTTLKSRDRAVFLGDYIDRGPNSKACIDLLISFLADYPKTIFLRGNHDQFMLSAFDEPVVREEGNYCIVADETALWIQNGGDTALASYGVSSLIDWQAHIPKEHMHFLAETRIEWKSKDFHFVHAGLVPKGVEWLETNRDPKLWIRDAFIDSREDFGRIVVFGHTPQPRHKPLVLSNKIGLDTGAVFGGALSVAKLNGVFRNSRGLPAVSVGQFYKKGDDVKRREWAS